MKADGFPISECQIEKKKPNTFIWKPHQNLQK